MKLIIYYVDFHADNYQGGSGKSFEFTTLVDVPSGLPCDDLWDFIHEKMAALTRKQRPFSTGESKYAIQKVEVL